MKRMSMVRLALSVTVTASLVATLPQNLLPQSVVVRPVSEGSDDAGPNAAGCGFSVAHNEIYLGECSNGQDIVSGFRFQNIPFSSPDEIQSAYIEFTVDGLYQNAVHVRLYGEAADDAPAFAQDSQPRDRATTTAYVDWQLTPQDAWSSGGKKSSPDLTAILREIVGRPGWQSGNAVVILLANVASNEEHRRVFAYEREGAVSAARLVINEPTPSFEIYPMTPRVWVLNYDPLIPSEGNRRLHDVANWYNPANLNATYRQDVQESSYDIVQYRLTRVVDADAFPVKVDGFRYSNGDVTDPDSYLYARANEAWHSPDGVDYHAIVRNFDLARKVDFGEVDEIWLHGGPGFGYYESRMAGRGSYVVNSPPLGRVASARKFVLMGFNYERDAGLMLHDLVHRTEAIMEHVYGSWTEDSTHAWNRFTLYDQIWPGGAACGNAHFAPNSTSAYDYGNMTQVWSTHRDWLENYPNLTGVKELVNATTWGGGDTRLYHKWWFEHLPHVAGSTTEYGMTRSNNWWHYVVDFNNYRESGDNRALGSFSASFPSTGTVVPLTSNAVDDWAPEINNMGRVVWHAYDGQDFEIFSAYANGFAVVQITDNNIDDENPRINNRDQIVWQAFDGTDFEIFTARADGSELTQITDNQTNDWHPALNDSGRIVWDGWDGKDYEIFSANLDGSDLTRITNNEAASGYPLEDVWPQINDAGQVVWMGYDGNDWEIYSADADGTNLRKLSTTDFDDEYPQLNAAGQVVWHTYHDDLNTEIHTATIGGTNDTVLSNNPREDWYPQINDSGQVVWMGHNGLHWDVYRVSLGGGTPEQITNGPTDHQYPRIDNTGFIAWQGFDGTDWEIFALLDDVVYQLSDNDSDDRRPAVSNSNAVWQGHLGYEKTSELYAFVINQPVPVELTSFTARSRKNSVTLLWATASETDNYGFEIERRQSGQNWRKIAFVRGHGTVTEPQSYRFVDAGLQPGTYAYRLKQIDLDGTFEYSEAVEVVVGLPTTFALSPNFPNPFNPRTTIEYQLPTPAQVRLEVYNLLGQRVKVLVEKRQKAGYYAVAWDGRDERDVRVASGIYIYRLKAGSFVRARKMIVLE